MSARASAGQNRALRAVRDGEIRKGITYWFKAGAAAREVHDRSLTACLRKTWIAFGDPAVHKGLKFWPVELTDAGRKVLANEPPIPKNQTPDGAIKFISHDENDVLLWMTAGENAGPFDSTMRVWNECIARLVKAGYVEKTGEGLGEVTITPAGEVRAAELRARRTARPPWAQS